MKIYTKTGDNGQTSLFGGRRVWKDDLRISAYGSIDELNAFLGVAVAEIKNQELAEIIKSIQNELFTVGSDLATPIDNGNTGFVIPRVNDSFGKRLELLIDKFDSQLPTLKNFILPCGAKGCSMLHLARTVCRRAEREIVALKKNEEINSEVEIYINRLSDLLFVLARFENSFCEIEDIPWKK
jgi:cob(I)alamin adenosyltransferase